MSETKVKWHKYPEEKPLFSDYYIATERAGEDETVTTIVDYDRDTNEFFSIEKDYDKLDTVLAWAELPEPYKESEAE